MLQCLEEEMSKYILDGIEEHQIREIRRELHRTLTVFVRRLAIELSGQLWLRVREHWHWSIEGAPILRFISRGAASEIRGAGTLATVCTVHVQAGKQVM